MAVKNHTILQGILRSGVPLPEVVEKYHLKINRPKRHPNLVQFKYDQINSDLSDPLVQQCRGIIMDEKDNWEIIARPFDKFFNAGEMDAAKIDWATARVLEKLDGTCCFLYYYDGWHVATLGSADASGPVGGFQMTFADLFWETFHDKHYTVPEPLWSGVTFIFELTSPYNRVVVNHAFSDLKLLGARTPSGDESSVAGIPKYEAVKSFPLTDLKAIEETFGKMDCTKQEGYVVVDGTYNRIKIKHPGYVRVHHMKDSFTLKNIVNCIRNGEVIEFLNYFPEHKDIVITVKDSFFALIEEIGDAFTLCDRAKSAKEFAAQATKFPFSGVLFAVRNGKQPSIVAALQTMNLDNLVDMLESKKQAAA
jgi:hypothetical protein